MQQNNNQIGFKAVAKYALLPGIIPLLRRLAARFGEFLHLFTLLFGAAGLIDKNHPCLRIENAGRYRFTDIVGLAASNVIFDKKHIPQVIMFFAVISAIILSAAFLMAIILHFLFASPATAYAQQYFSQQPMQEGKDIAFKFLREIFGETGLSHIWDKDDRDMVCHAGECKQNGLPVMLKAMLSHYSMALLVIAIFMIIYLSVMALVDTAQSGKPFGSKMDNVWAPIRLVFAIGLLVPISSGYNAAQLIVFQSAHWGSVFATNTWRIGMESYTNSGAMISTPQPEAGYKFIRAVLLSRVCVEAWNKYAANVETMASRREVNDSPITITYGYGTSNEFDYCGSIKVPYPKYTVYLPSYNFATGRQRNSKVNNFSKHVLQKYSEAYDEIDKKAEEYAKKIVARAGPGGDCDLDHVPGADTIHKELVDIWRKKLNYDDTSKMFFYGAADPRYKTYLEELNTNTNNIISNVTEGGWAYAGSFFLTISKINSDTASAVSEGPSVGTYPKTLDTSIATPGDWTIPSQIYNDMVKSFCKLGGIFGGCAAEQAAEKTSKMLVRVRKWFIDYPSKDPVLAQYLDYSTTFKTDLQDVDSSNSSSSAVDLNIGQGVLNSIFKAAVQVDHLNLNPIGLLMNWGQGLLLAANALYVVTILAYGTIVGAGLGKIVFAVAGAMFIGGVTLTFVLPLIPILNFAFAVIEWVMSIFEAVVGIPLWALSFITLKGDLIEAGPKNGITMLFEIILRPTIIVISFIGSIMFFSASVHYINVIWNSYIETISSSVGVDTSGLVSYAKTFYLASIDVYGFFFYLFSYLFVVWSIGNSVFKLISVIPNNFSRWSSNMVGKGFSGIIDTGASVSTLAVMSLGKQFSDAAANASESWGKKLEGRKKKKDEGDVNPTGTPPTTPDYDGGNNPPPSGGGGGSGGGGMPSPAGFGPLNARVGRSYDSPYANYQAQNNPGIMTGENSRVGRSYSNDGSRLERTSDPEGAVVDAPSPTGQAGNEDAGNTGSRIGNSYTRDAGPGSDDPANTMANNQPPITDSPSLPADMTGNDDAGNMGSRIGRTYSPDTGLSTGGSANTMENNQPPPPSVAPQSEMSAEEARRREATLRQDFITAVVRDKQFDYRVTSPTHFAEYKQRRSEMTDAQYDALMKMPGTGWERGTKRDGGSDNDT